MSINTVDFTRPEYKAAAPQWKLVRDVCRGGEDINTYLPELIEQDDARKRNAIRTIKTARCFTQ